MIAYDYIIVGQGIAGTVLHRKLTLSGYKTLIIDQGHDSASSRVAAGLINPITGRKYVKSWRIEDFLPVAKSTYEELSSYLGAKVFSEVNIHRALYSVKDENIWHGRKEDPLASQYIKEEADTSAYNGKINRVLSYGSLKDGLQIHLPLLIGTYRNKLRENSELLEEVYEAAKLDIAESEVRYKGHTAKAIIFAEGHAAKHNPLWEGLTFTPVKGEVLHVRIEGNPFPDVLRHKLFITPLPDGTYWIGSGYKWEFADHLPTEEGRAALEEQLKEVLSVPFEVVQHTAGVRPSVKDRKPFLGKHPEKDHTYIFNGMGTKGTSLAPYWAEHFIKFLTRGATLDDEVNILNKY